MVTTTMENTMFKRTLAALALAVPLLSPAAVTLELGHITLLEGGSGDLPFTLTLDTDLTLVALDAWADFDGTRIAFDPTAPMFGTLSLDGLDALPGWDTGSDETGFVIAGAPLNPVRNPIELSAAAPYTGTLHFTGLVAGVVPVSVRVEMCDLDSCFFGDPIEPIVVEAQGSVTVSVVPEPAAWMLLAGGLLAIGRLSSSRRT